MGPSDAETTKAANDLERVEVLDRITPTLVDRRQRWRSLAKLMGDESPRVWSEVRRAALNEGAATRVVLRMAEAQDDARARTRARGLLLELDQRDAVRRLLRHVARPAIELEPALFMLARFHHPGLDPRPWQQRLDDLAREVRLRAERRADPLQRALTLVEYLGTELGYGGSKGEYHDPDNIHVQRVLETGQGMPLTLCAIYLFVARRAGLRAGCLPLPGHVMLRLSAAGTNVIVDPYHKGQPRTERDCRRYLEENGLGFQPAWFRDASDALLFRRQVANLARSAEQRGKHGERRLLNQLQSALERRAPALTPTA